VNKVIAHWISRRWLSAYLDAELTGVRLQRVCQHVGGCRACQQHVEQIRAGRELVLRWEVPQGLPRESQPPLFPRLPAARWAGITLLAVAVVVASTYCDSWKWLAGWWRPTSVHAVDVNFYAAQFRRTNHCAPPCTSLEETTLDELRSSPPFAVQYPNWLPEGMVLRRVIRYRTPRYEGVGLVFAGHGKRFCLFQQPPRLVVATSGLRTSETRICGRRCTWIDGDQVQLYRWMTREFCFVVATNLGKDEVERVVDSLRALSE
jgi:anti-sigma factor RsiW